MQTLEREYDLELEFDPEELKQMSQLLTEKFLEQFESEDAKAQFTLITCVSGYEIIKEDQIVEVVNLDLVASATAGVLDPLGQLMEWFTGLIDSIASFIISSLEVFIETYVLPAISGVTSSLQLFIETYVLPAFDVLQNFINTYVLPAISGVTDFVSTHVLPAIDKVIPSISDFISTYVLPAIDGISPAITGFISVNVLPAISGVLTGVSDLISDYVLPAITGIIPTITSFLDAYVTPILYNIASTVSIGFHQLGTAIMGFVNSILKFPEWFPRWFETYISRPIVEGITRLPIIRPFGDPLGWLVDTLRPALEGLVDALWGAIEGLGRMILAGLRAIAEWLIEGIKGLAAFIGNLLMSGFQALNDVFAKVGEPFQGFVKGIYESVIESTISLMVDFTAKPFEGILKEFEMETPEILKMDYITKQWGLAHAYSFGIWLLPFLGQLPVRLTQWTMRAFARWVGDHEWVTRINLRPLGLGVDFEFNWAKAIASSLWHTSGELMKWLDEIPRGIIYGYAIWMTQPMTRLANAYLKDILPVEFPREDILLEFTRRMIPHEKFQDIWKLVRYYTALYGYSTMVSDQFFKLAEELYIEVTDRFEKERKVPLSLMHELPSASDVATMMVRDIFFTLEDFQNLYKARGMMPDVGALYYFLRFRYPPPERLWQFTMRGISGLLWTTLPNTEREEIKKEAEPLGAWVKPEELKAPIELNFQPETLFNAFKTYMKWHDMARFSWIKGFTSDNLIYIDTLADIPTKIEQRWGLKWGLYELLSAKGVRLDSPVSEFRTKIIEGQPKSEVRMDLTLFARTVQATGLHPDWVPLTVVAEAINALADERTLLRTGFVSLFKEGFWNVDSLEKLLAGIIMASFQVSYFNIEEMKWGTGWVNQPVMFLPAERKLIELRALMDRALDILRETARDISRGYSEWIVETYEEYEGMLTSIIDKINEFFSLDYQKITGLTLPEELKLKFVKEYYEPYIASLDIWRDIYTIRRVRYWTQRWLGWIMYRVATGVVAPEDIEEFVAYVGEKAKLTPYETEFIQGVLERMMGIALREYIPTPSMLATISEIVPKAREFFNEVMKVRRVPEEWIPIWADYVDLRPIMGEVRRMLSRAEDLYVYFMVPEEDYRKVLDEIREFGYTDKEIELMLRSANYERQRRAWAELIGDVDRMVMLSEYSPKARDFALGTMQKMIDALPINQPTKAVLKEMWEQYIRLRPVMDEVRRYVTELIAAFVEGIITEQEFQNELEALKEWGLDDYEITFYKAIAGMRKARKLAPRL